MEKITTVGIDLAKAVFSLHGVDGAGHVVLMIVPAILMPIIEMNQLVRV